MNITDAEALAKELMREHQLNLVGWTFHYDRAKRRFGQCNYAERTISLSKPLTEINDEAQVRDTLLHEIAHALVGAGHGHDSAWRAMCREIGAKPKRTYSLTEVQVPEATRKRPSVKVGQCPNCERKVYRRRRMNIACGVCCRKYNHNRYSDAYKIAWQE